MLILTPAAEPVKPAAIIFDSAAPAPALRFGKGLLAYAPAFRVLDHAPADAAFEAGRSAGLDDAAPIVPADCSGRLASAWLDGWAEGSADARARLDDHIREMEEMALALDSLSAGYFHG